MNAVIVIHKRNSPLGARQETKPLESYGFTVTGNMPVHNQTIPIGMGISLLTRWLPRSLVFSFATSQGYITETHVLAVKGDRFEKNQSTLVQVPSFSLYSSYYFQEIKFLFFILPSCLPLN